MFTSFEIKSYPQLQFALGIFNTFLVVLVFITFYQCVLIPDHIKIVDNLLARAKLDQIISGVPVLLGLAGLWGWLSAIVFRFHDRIHEPRITKWRAWYDADFILRALCYGFSSFFSPDLFERAYEDKRVGDKLMSRLFYHFAGDSISTLEGKRIFFYTIMWKYWSIALLDLYSTFALVAMLTYCLYTKSNVQTIPALVLIALVTLSRIIAHHFIDEAHSITLEQIHAIKTGQADDLRTAATEVARELGGLLQ